MIVTTTPSVEGRKIREYKGIVFGEIVSGVNFIKDFAAGLTNFFGGRSGSYEGELIEARDQAIMEMVRRAESLGANAVVGVDVDYEVLGQGEQFVHDASARIPEQPRFAFAAGLGINDGLNAAHDAISALTRPGFDGMPRHGRDR